MASSSRRALMIAHRREIVNQTSAKLTAFGVHHGVIQAGDDDRLRPMAAVQVASIQTLHARAIRSATMTMPLADIVVIDEAHHSCAMTYQTVLAAYPHATVLGLTATPCRGDGRGLGGIFSTLIEAPQVPDLIEQGYLVKAKVYAPVDPDLRGVRTQAGDYVETQLAERMARTSSSATSSRTGSSTASAARPSPSPAASATRSISVMSSAALTFAQNTSTVRRRSMSAPPSSPSWPSAILMSSPTAWC
jgi:superfamily II DNA or RNA helicase